jgi:predicted permease
MKVIEPRPRGFALLARLCGRGDAGQGEPIAEDVIELYRERRGHRGRVHAAARAAWDVATLLLRSRPPGVASDRNRWAWWRLWADVRDACRSLVRRPVAGLAACVAMMLGMALTTLTFVVVRGVLIEPLPFPEGHRLVSVATEFRAESGYDIPRLALSWPELLDLQAASRSVDAGAFLPVSVNLAPAGAPAERVPGARASSALFRLLGVPPATGTTLLPLHDEPGSPCGVVLSDPLWRSHFAADPQVAGRSLDVNGAPCRVLGVMPAHFTFPSERTRVWIPFPIERNPDDRGSHGVLAIGRLRPGVTLAAARAETAALMTGWAARHTHHRGHGIVLTAYASDLVGEVRRPLLVVAASVGLVLFVMAANVASLFLARGEARRRELAVRAALGAGRPRLVSVLAWEVLIATLAGGAAGIAIASLSAASLVAAYPGSLPRASAVQVDGRAVVVMAIVSLGIGLAVAAVPALRLTRRSLFDVLRSDSRAGGASRRPQRALVIAELVLSVAATVGALLLVQSYLRLQAVPMGFDPQGVEVASVSLPGASPGAEAGATAFFAELLARLTADPGIAEAGALSTAPLVGRPPPDLFMIEGRPIPAPGEPGPIAHYVMATPGALEALRTPILRGRSLSASDRSRDAPVAVINESLQRRYWPDADPVGRRIRYPTDVRDGQWTRWTPWITVVGVAADIRSIAPVDPPEPAIYVSYAQRPRGAYPGTTMTLVVRVTEGGAAARVREVARALDDRAVVTPPRELTDALGAALARPRFMGGLMSAFAVIAYSIALVGLYALVSHGVARRAREFGLRIALGASRRHVAGLALRQLAAALAIGLPAGLAGAWLLSQWMASLLYDVRPWEPVTYAGAALGMAVVAVAATLGPIRRALRVDPVVALRAE